MKSDSLLKKAGPYGYILPALLVVCRIPVLIRFSRPFT